jgi:hypothetical protein
MKEIIFLSTLHSKQGDGKSAGKYRGKAEAVEL